MNKFIVTFKSDSGNRGTKTFISSGFKIEVISNSSASPHESEVKKAVELKLGVSFPYSCAPGLWEVTKI